VPVSALAQTGPTGVPVSALAQTGPTGVPVSALAQTGPTGVPVSALAQTSQFTKQFIAKLDLFLVHFCLPKTWEAK